MANRQNGVCIREASRQAQTLADAASSLRVALVCGVCLRISQVRKR
jgi:hypothetical protein